MSLHQSGKRHSKGPAQNKLNQIPSMALQEMKTFEELQKDQVVVEFDERKGV